MKGKSNGKVYKYDLQGNFISEYENMQAAMELNNLSAGSIVGHLIHKTQNHCVNHIYTFDYYIKLPKKYLDKKLNYNSFVTVIRQICNHLKITYTSQVKYDKSVYDIIYYIYF